MERQQAKKFFQKCQVQIYVFNKKLIKYFYLSSDQALNLQRCKLLLQQASTQVLINRID